MHCLTNYRILVVAFTADSLLLLPHSLHASVPERMNLKRTEELAQVHWDIAKLLESGVNAELIQELDRSEIRDLLKAVLYLEARHGSEDSEASELR